MPGDVVTLIGSEGSVLYNGRGGSLPFKGHHQLRDHLRHQAALGLQRVFTNEIVSEAGEEVVGEPVPVEAMIEEAE